MKNLIKDTIGKIKKQQIAPESKWRFLVARYGAWVLFGLVAFFGAGALSVAYYIVTNLDWDLYHFGQRGFFLYTFSILPHFWFILVAILLVVAFLDIRKSEMGYRFNWLKILLTSLGIILLAGMIMSWVGFGHRLNSVMVDKMPYYGRHMVVSKEAQWMRPEQGFLAGRIISVGEQELEIEDLDGGKWKIQANIQTLIGLVVRLEKGEIIKIIGVKQGQGIFEASEIRPWVGMGMKKEMDRKRVSPNERLWQGGMMRNN